MAKKKVIPNVEVDDDDLDGCCVEFNEANATPDDELPIALGGVAMVDESDDLDGCDVDFNQLDPTPDDELPATIGGVA